MSHVRSWVPVTGVLLAALVGAPASSAGCAGDLNRDGRVSGEDLGMLLGAWGSTDAGSEFDLDGDGVVGGSDLGQLLGDWGQCPGVPDWATLERFEPDPAVVTDPALREAIVATGLAWHVRDTATQIELLLVPPGVFEMGCTMNSTLYQCSGNKNRVHTVQLTQPFYLGRSEVTQAQWQATIGSNPSWFRSFPDSPLRPVEQVSWDQIQGFLLATRMRLPTEAQWERACRAGTSTPFPNGSTDDGTVGTFAWFSGNAGGATRPVGGRAANGLGFVDMLGNVHEAVNDWWGDYTFDPQVDPTGPATGQFRVYRGGGYGSNTSETRSSWRSNAPSSSTGKNRGFRVARDP